MVNIESVNELRKHADISFEEARSVLEETNGDLLDAIVLLERQGRIQAPRGGGFYNSKDQLVEEPVEETSSKKKTSERESFGEVVRKILSWTGKLIARGNKNSFEVKRDEEIVITIPLTILVLLSLVMFWIIIPLIVVGLFFGYSYSFKGPDLGREDINRAMDTVAQAAENFKKEVKGVKSDGENTDN